MMNRLTIITLLYKLDDHHMPFEKYLRGLDGILAIRNCNVVIITNCEEEIKAGRENVAIRNVDIDDLNDIVVPDEYFERIFTPWINKYAYYRRKVSLRHLRLWLYKPLLANMHYRLFETPYYYYHDTGNMADMVEYSGVDPSLFRLNEVKIGNNIAFTFNESYFKLSTLPGRLKNPIMHPVCGNAFLWMREFDFDMFAREYIATANRMIGRNLPVTDEIVIAAMIHRNAGSILLLPQDDLREYRARLLKSNIIKNNEHINDDFRILWNYLDFQLFTPPGGAG